MNKANLLAFALAATPYLAYLVAMAFISVASKDGRRWPFIGFSAFAFALAIWQQSYLSTLFNDWPQNLDVETKTVLGVDMPLELGKAVHNSVSSAFWVLMIMVLIASFVISVARPLTRALMKR